ncbi:MAG: cobalamin-binding protein, partial [Verrucomicrobia bacterium]|nr:cobalamin-binding protein [Verrucomicrobiota bacterium]
AIKLVGGEDVFYRPEARAAQERQVEPGAVCRADPQIIFASWCGKPVDARRIASRPGWEAISAVKRGAVYEIAAGDILQPGPGVVEGIKQMAAIIERWREEAGRFSR